MACEVVVVAAVEVVGAHIHVGGLPAEQMVSNHQNRMSHGHRRLLAAPPSCEPTIQRAEIRLARACAGASRLNQRRTQPLVAFAGLATLTFASTLVIPRAHPSPRRQMRRGWKSTHVESDLGDPDL